MKFLVVDDSVTMRRIIMNTLQGVGNIDCVEAADGVEALERFGPEIDVVITDWNMPNMGGLELVQTLRAHPDGAQVPVLMVTARRLREDISAAAQAGVNNYIVKPFTPQVLREKIDQVITTAAGAI